MTCQVYVDLINDSKKRGLGLESRTAAKRTALIKHFTECLACQTWTTNRAKKYIAEHTSEHVFDIAARAVEAVERDKFDPEVQP